MGILDVTVRGNIHVGCQNLIDTIRKSPPKVHIFGHIHEAYGIEVHDDVKYINASVLNLNYEFTNPPIEFELFVNE